MAFQSLNGECLDSAAILPRFNALFPSYDQAGNFTDLQSSSVSGTTLNYVLVTRPAASNVPFQRTGTVALTSCDPALNYKAFTIPQGADFGNAWALGFVTPMTIGLIAACVSKIVSMFDD